MSVASIANDLVVKCRTGSNMAAIEAHYSPNIVSIESAGNPAEVRGIEGVKGKNKWWIENHEVHGAQIEGPFIGEKQFAVHFSFEITPKATGKRVTMNEMALYTVEGDKIVREKFFYHA